MPAYDEFRAEAIMADKALRNNPCQTNITRKIVNGIEFRMHVIQQSHNWSDAVQVLHYVNGKKVSKPMFKDQLSQLSTQP